MTNKKKAIAFILALLITSILYVLWQNQNSKQRTSPLSTAREKEDKEEKETTQKNKVDTENEDVSKNKQTKDRNEEKSLLINEEELDQIREITKQKNQLLNIVDIRIDRIHSPSKYEVTVKSITQQRNYYLKAYLNPKTGLFSKTWGGTRYENRDHMVIPVKK